MIEESETSVAVLTAQKLRGKSWSGSPLPGPRRGAAMPREEMQPARAFLALGRQARLRVLAAFMSALVQEAAAGDI